VLVCVAAFGAALAFNTFLALIAAIFEFF